MQLPELVVVCVFGKKKEYIKNKVSVSLAEDQLVALVANSE